MRVSIVIRAYNEDAHLEKLLIGIKAQTRRADEVILVDSGSTDRTVEIAKEHGVKVVPIAKHNFTFGRALNYGCEAATGDICIFPSAHVYPRRTDWIAQMVAPFENDDVVLTYGRQVGGDVNKFSEHQIFARWFPPASETMQNGYFCNNANCAIRRSEWELDKYDETLTGLEDLAWAKAAKERGGHIAYVAEATIVHLHDETWPQVHNRYRREAIAMRSIDQHAKFSRWDLMRLLLSNVSSDLVAAKDKGVLREELGSILKFRYNQLTGTYRGHNDPPDVSRELRYRFYYPNVSFAGVSEGDDSAALVIDYDRFRQPAGQLSPGFAESEQTSLHPKDVPSPSSGKTSRSVH